MSKQERWPSDYLVQRVCWGGSVECFYKWESKIHVEATEGVVELVLEAGLLVSVVWAVNSPCDVTVQVLVRLMLFLFQVGFHFYSPRVPASAWCVSLSGCLYPPYPPGGNHHGSPTYSS